MESSAVHNLVHENIKHKIMEFEERLKKLEEGS